MIVARGPEEAHTEANAGPPAPLERPPVCWARVYRDLFRLSTRWTALARETIPRRKICLLEMQRHRGKHQALERNDENTVHNQLLGEGTKPDRSWASMNSLTLCLTRRFYRRPLTTTGYASKGLALCGGLRGDIAASTRLIVKNKEFFTFLSRDMWPSASPVFVGVGGVDGRNQDTAVRHSVGIVRTQYRQDLHSLHYEPASKFTLGQKSSLCWSPTPSVPQDCNRARSLGLIRQRGLFIGAHSSLELCKCPSTVPL